MNAISRRSFLERGAMTTAALAASMPRTSVALAPSTPIGIQLYTVDKELKEDVPGTLRQVRAIGYAEVETAGFAGLTPKQFRNALNEAGLTCHSAHLQMNTAELGPVFDDAESVGAHYAVCSAMLPASASSEATIDDYKKMAARLNEIGRVAKSRGLQYAYHNHNMEFGKLDGGTIGYDVLLQETDPELVDFEIDCGWMIAAGYSPVDYFKRYAARIKMLHIKDFVRGSKISTSLAKDLRPQGTELGRGHIDYKPVLAAATAIGIRHFYVEQEPPFLDMPALQAARVDYYYLHGLAPFA
jgi:sugar phosphate isomerase/epimerase